jgi:hypothetical protein
MFLLEAVISTVDAFLGGADLNRSKRNDCSLRIAQSKALISILIKSDVRFECFTHVGLLPSKALVSFLTVRKMATRPSERSGSGATENALVQARILHEL